MFFFGDSTLVNVHVGISLVAIAAGFVVIWGLWPPTEAAQR